MQTQKTIQDPQRKLNISKLHVALVTLCLTLPVIVFIVNNLGKTNEILTHAQSTFNQNLLEWNPNGNTTIEISSDEGIDSSGALSITVDESGPWQDNSGVARVGTHPVALEPGTYNASAHLKNESGRSVLANCVILAYYDGMILTTTEDPVNQIADENWTKLSCKGDIPIGATSGYIQIQIFDTQYGEEFLLDNVSLYKTSDEAKSSEENFRQHNH